MSARLAAEIEALQAELDLARLALLAVDHGAQPPTIEVLRRFHALPPHPLRKRCRMVARSFAADGVEISAEAIEKRVRRLNARRFGPKKGTRASLN